MPRSYRKKPSAEDFEHLIGRVVRLRSRRERFDGSEYVDESCYYVIAKVERSKVRHEIGMFAWGVATSDDAFAPNGKLVKLARAERIESDLLGGRTDLNVDGVRWEEM